MDVPPAMGAGCEGGAMPADEAQERKDPARQSDGGLPIFARLMDNIETIILGKHELVETLVAALVAREGTS